MFTHKTQPAQSIALIALSLVGLIAMVALAIDGGNAFAERRRAQSAADDGALAGGLAIVHDPGDTSVNSAILTAVHEITRAASNNFPDAVVSVARGIARSDGHRGAQFVGCNGSTILVDAILTSEIPNNDPINHPTDYLQVMINSSVDTYFGQIVGIPQLNYCVQAIVRAKPFRLVKPFFGGAVVGLDTGGTPYDSGQSNSAHWIITGGGIFANDDAFSKNIDSVEFPDGACVTAVNTASNFNCPVSQNNPELFVPYPDGIIPILPPIPACDGIATKGGDGKIYPDADTTKNGSVVDPTVVQTGWAGDYAPGLYCIFDGGNIHDGITGVGVTFYIMATDFNVNFSGRNNPDGSYQDGGYIGASATNDPSSPYFGVLLFSGIADAPCETFTQQGVQNIQIRGNGSTPIVGTILMPSACVDYRGNGMGELMDSQMIGYNVTSNGTADVAISYKPNDNYKFPQAPVIELNK